MISFAWRYWQQYQIQQSEGEQIYQQLGIALAHHDDKDSPNISQQLMHQAVRTPYPSAALLLLAKNDIQAMKFAQAIPYFNGLLLMDQ